METYCKLYIPYITCALVASIYRSELLVHFY
jgi:hypothetical protein